MQVDEDSLPRIIGPYTTLPTDPKQRARLINLQKARDAKARRKKENEEAVARGEMPLSYLGKVNNPIPAIKDYEGHVLSFDVKEALWNTDVSIKLPQLAYHSPWILEQILHYLGGDLPRKKADKKDQVHLAEEPNYQAHSNNNTKGLQAVYILIGDHMVEGLVDAGWWSLLFHLAVIIGARHGNGTRHATNG